MRSLTRPARADVELRCTIATAPACRGPNGNSRRRSLTATPFLVAVSPRIE
jgi:hypothetical protein